MRNNLKAMFRQLLGPGFGQAGKRLLTCFILFFALYSAEIRLAVSLLVLFLTSGICSAGVMWQTLNASSNEALLQGLLLLPIKNRQLTVSLVLGFGGYTLLTKTAPIWAVFLALSRWRGAEMAAAVFWSVHGCLAAAGVYGLRKENRGALAMLGAVCVPGAAVWYLSKADPYVWLPTHSSARTVRCFGGRGSVAGYLLRYLLANKNYLLNTLALMAAGAFLPLLLGSFQNLYVLPLGFAMLCLNTPMCILLSCDRDLEQTLRMLPGQAHRFCVPYGLFLAAVHMGVSCVYLVSWQVQYGSVTGRDMLLGAVFALQSALLSVLLEWRHPIRGWKVESDLWHHPRKYLVPLVMLVTATLVGSCPALTWVLLCMVLLTWAGALLVTK